MSALERKLEHMRRIFRGEVSYGSGSATEQASRYRLEQMYDDIVDAALANQSDPVPEVDTLISLSGFTPETTLLAFEFVKPKQLLIISSSNVADKTDVIHEKLHGRLRPTQIQFRMCDPTDPLEIYDVIKKAVRPQSDSGAVPAIIDITGGKKVMSASAALAATQLNLRMCYIDGRYDPEMRVAVPGTERLIVLANPATLFGDQDLVAAKEMFSTGVFAGAEARFAELSTSMSEPVLARFLCDLSALYQAWCDLDTANLRRLADSVQAKLQDPRLGLLAATRDRLIEQLAFVQRVAAKDGSSLLLTFFLLGEHYQAMGRLDFAALLFYRAIEQSLADRLRRVYRGFDMEKPDYTLLADDQEDLRLRYLDARAHLFPDDNRDTLPREVGLLDALLLLHVLRDALLPAADIKDISGVKYIKELVTTRNRSVLAHGHNLVTQDECELLRNRALCNLRAFWKLHHRGVNVDERIDALRFVTGV